MAKKKARKKNEPNTVVRDGKARTVCMGTRDQCFRYIKHHCQDGDYNVVGPSIDVVVLRKNRVVYLTAGTIDGFPMPPTSDQEAQDIFGTP